MPDPDGCCVLLSQILTFLFGWFAPAIPEGTDCCATIARIIGVVQQPVGPIVTSGNLVEQLQASSPAVKPAVRDILAEDGISPDWGGV